MVWNTPRYLFIPTVRLVEYEICNMGTRRLNKVRMVPDCEGGYRIINLDSKPDNCSESTRTANTTFSSSSSSAASSSVSTSSIQRLQEARSKRHKQRLTFFNSEDGTRLWTRVRDHPLTTLPTRTRCALCNVNNSHNKGSIRIKTFCTMCKVALCTERRNFSFSCWDSWHNSRVLKQRVNK